MPFLMGSCTSSPETWNSPRKIYSLLCSCKNSAGLTVDDQLVQVLNEKGIPASSTDEINRYIHSNTDEYIRFIDAYFKNDSVYMSNLRHAQDTLESHGAILDPKGNIGTLFSIKAKYPACIPALAYINQ